MSASTSERPTAAPGNLVTCFGCQGRWWGTHCDVCGDWGVIHITRYAEGTDTSTPLPAPVLEQEG